MPHHRVMTALTNTSLLDSIRESLEFFILGGEHEQVFASFLETMLAATESQYGFIDELLQNEDGALMKRSLALSKIAWDDDSRALYDELRQNDFQFHNMENLAGLPIMTGETVIANTPLADHRSSGLPQGHPPLTAFMGIPLFFGGRLVGVAGMANRADGYSDEDARFIAPLLSTCASVIHALQSQRKEERYLAAIQEERHNFLSLLEMMPAHIHLVREDYSIAFANKYFRNLFGASQGKKCYQLLRERDSPCEKCPIQGVLSSHTPQHHEWTNPKTGRTYLIYFSFYSGMDDSPMVLKFGLDISDRKRDEESLKKSETMFRTLADSTHDWEFWLGPEGDYRYISPSCRRISGYTAAEFKNNPDLLFEITHPDDRRKLKRHLQSSNREQKEELVEFRIIRRDGSLRWISQVSQPVFDAQGNIAGCRTSNRDITTRKLTKQALQKEIDQLEEQARKKASELAQTSIALDVLLKKREQDKLEQEKKIVHNIKELIEPYLETLHESRLDERQQQIVETIQSNLREIFSPLIDNVAIRKIALTPTENKVANLIKHGRSTKEIADILHLAPDTIHIHRKNIRKKLGLRKSKVNLRSFLASHL